MSRNENLSKGLKQGLTNTEGKVVDLYIPRKCTETNNIISANDHASVQINIGRVDVNGHYTGEFDTVAFCGALRKAGRSDNAMNRYCLRKKIMRDI